MKGCFFRSSRGVWQQLCHWLHRPRARLTPRVELHEDFFFSPFFLGDLDHRKEKGDRVCKSKDEMSGFVFFGFVMVWGDWSLGLFFQGGVNGLMAGDLPDFSSNLTLSALEMDQTIFHDFMKWIGHTKMVWNCAKKNPTWPETTSNQRRIRLPYFGIYVRKFFVPFGFYARKRWTIRFFSGGLGETVGVQVGWWTPTFISCRQWQGLHGSTGLDREVLLNGIFAQQDGCLHLGVQWFASWYGHEVHCDD